MLIPPSRLTDGLRYIHIKNPSVLIAHLSAWWSFSENTWLPRVPTCTPPGRSTHTLPVSSRWCFGIGSDLTSVSSHEPRGHRVKHLDVLPIIPHHFLFLQWFVRFTPQARKCSLPFLACHALNCVAILSLMFARGQDHWNTDGYNRFLLQSVRVSETEWAKPDRLSRIKPRGPSQERNNSGIWS